MSAQVVPLRPKPCRAIASSIPRETLDQLHRLLRLDPIAGGAATRVLFVVSDEAKARLGAHLPAGELEAALAAPALALIGFDFLFAVSLLLAGSTGTQAECAAAVRSAQLSARLQCDSVALAARAVGLSVKPVAAFDAAALKAAFFGGCETTVLGIAHLAPEAVLNAPSAFEDLA